MVAGHLRLPRYPGLLHQLTCHRRNHGNLHVRGYRQEGTTTTPFDMTVLNNLDRLQLALDAILRVPRLVDRYEETRQRYWSDIERHRLHASENGMDLPDIRHCNWQPTEN